MSTHRFIVIDDDPFNNRICSITLQKLLPETEVKTYTDPQVGFDYIAATYHEQLTGAPTVLFLDINMPIINGWQFLEMFETLPETAKNQIVIYILSSSVDKRDMERASQIKYVKDYLVKPLTRDAIKQVIVEQL